MALKLLSELQEVFTQYADPERAKGQQAYMKSAMPCWGLSLPDVRKIGKQVFKNYIPQNNQDYRDVLWHVFYKAQRREEWYAGMDYAKQFKTFVIEKNVDLYLDIIRLTKWWDVVDDFAANLVGSALRDSNKKTTYMRTWIVDENMWIRRTALLAQLKYKEKTDKELLAELITTVMHEKEFFIRKAIGWALRSYSYANPSCVKQFIKKHEDELSGLSIREGLKAINRQAKREI